MADTPQFLTLARNRDSRTWVELAARWTVMSLLVVLFAVALLNVFGQSPTGSRAVGAAGVLEVSAPTAVRGGIYFQGRFTVEARQDIEKATLVLDSGWVESMHINTIEPAPVGESSRDGKLALDFGHLGPGDRLVAYLQFQVNPTNLGRRSQDVELYDDTTLLARVDRTVTVLP